MRNTYDTKNPYNKSSTNANQQPKQRETYTAVNPKMMSFQKQAPHKSVQTVQKMNRNILDALKRLSINNETKVLGLASLKPAGKTLTGIIGMFLNSFDNMFDQSCLTIDVLPQLFKCLGYPNQINKTYFQPIGAPHTWNQCLMMMDWLAELAIFHIDIRSHLQQGDFDEDFTSMLIRAHLQNNITIPKQHLQQSIAKKSQKIEDLMYHTNTHTLEIDNIKASQKDLNIMQDEKKRLQSILNRQTQQVIQVSQQNNQMQRRLKQLQAKIQQQKRMSQIHDDEITSLRQQIQSQQLSVEQVQRIRYQIRDFHQKITQMKRYYQEQKQQMDKIDNNIIDEYMQFNKTLQVVRLMYRKHQQNMQRRNVYMKIPQCEIGVFTQFVKARKEEWSQLRTEQLLGVKEIKEIKQKAQLLIQSITKQIRASQNTREQLHSQNRQLNEQCQHQAFRTNEIQSQLQQSKKKLQSVKNKISQSQLVNFQLTSQMTRIQQQIRLALSQQQQLIKQADLLARQGMELGHLKLSLQNEVNQSISRMQERLNDYQFQCLELLENDCEYFQQSAVEQGCGQMEMEMYEQQNNIQQQGVDSSHNIGENSSLNNINNAYNSDREKGQATPKNDRRYNRPQQFN